MKGLLALLLWATLGVQCKAAEPDTVSATFSVRVEASPAGSGEVWFEIADEYSCMPIFTEGVFPRGIALDFYANPNIADPEWAEGRFRQWADGNTDNPRRVVLEQDTLLVAVFEKGDVGIAGVVPLKVELSPNPVSDRLLIASPSEMEGVDFIALDGRAVMHRKVSGREAVVDVAGLSGGIYLVRVIMQEGIATRKLVVKG